LILLPLTIVCLVQSTVGLGVAWIEVAELSVNMGRTKGKLKRIKLGAKVMIISICAVVFWMAVNGQSTELVGPIMLFFLIMVAVLQVGARRLYKLLKPNGPEPNKPKGDEYVGERSLARSEATSRSNTRRAPLGPFEHS